MARHESAFETDDPLLIEVGNIYRAWRASAGPEAAFIVDIQNAIAPYLSHPENGAKGLPTNIGYEQTPEQKRENIRRAIVDMTPTDEVYTPATESKSDAVIISEKAPGKGMAMLTSWNVSGDPDLAYFSIDLPIDDPRSVE